MLKCISEVLKVNDRGSDIWGYGISSLSVCWLQCLESLELCWYCKVFPLISCFSTNIFLVATVTVLYILNGAWDTMMKTSIFSLSSLSVHQFSEWFIQSEKWNVQRRADHTNVTPAILLWDFFTPLYRLTQMPCAAAHVATATDRITNMASSDSDNDILASSLVLLSSIANQQRRLSLRTQKRKNATI